VIPMKVGTTRLSRVKMNRSITLSLQGRAKTEKGGAAVAAPPASQVTL
jgi:hypothetical protein